PARRGAVLVARYGGETVRRSEPIVFSCGAAVYHPSSPLTESRRDLVERNPDLVQRFVNASIIGWYNYIYGDNRAGNDLIKKHNPEMTDELLAYSVAKMKQYGIVDSGDARELGVGAMTDARIKSFFDKMVRAGVVKAGLDYHKAYTLQFVNKRVGIDLRPRN